MASEQSIWLKLKSAFSGECFKKAQAECGNVGKAVKALGPIFSSVAGKFGDLAKSIATGGQKDSAAAAPKKTMSSSCLLATRQPAAANEETWEESENNRLETHKQAVEKQCKDELAQIDKLLAEAAKKRDEWEGNVQKMRGKTFAEAQRDRVRERHENANQDLRAKHEMKIIFDYLMSVIVGFELFATASDDFGSSFFSDKSLPRPDRTFNDLTPTSHRLSPHGKNSDRLILMKYPPLFPKPPPQIGTCSPNDTFPTTSCVISQTLPTMSKSP